MELIEFMDPVFQVLAGSIKRVGIHLEAAPIVIVDCVSDIARAGVRMEWLKNEDLMLSCIRWLESYEYESECEECRRFSEVYDFRFCLVRHDGLSISRLFRRVVEAIWG